MMTTKEPRPVEWPNGTRSAVAFTFDFDAEEVWIGEDAANADKPGVLSQGTYGAKVGVPLLLDLLDRVGMTATFFVPGRVAARHPRSVENIVAAGHELAHHGYTHTSPQELDRDEGEAELLKGREILQSFGAEVVGYRSPSWDFSGHTLELLQTHGFAYSSNLMDDIRPYRHVGSGLAEIPIQWILDDAPHFWFDGATWEKKISTPDEVRSLWLGEFEGIHGLGGCTVLTMHPQIIGRPGRLPMLENVLHAINARDDVWVATCRQIAEQVP
jgi:peptidoglycan/xylan/chitin deacetylase (PgdA/CDA1 family)